MATNEVKEKILKQLKDEYITDSDVCMFDFLATTSVPTDEELTFEDAMEIYVQLMNWAENDMFYRENTEDGFRVDIVNNIHIKI